MNITKHLLAAGFSVLLGFSFAANATPVSYTWDFTGSAAATGNPAGLITTGPNIPTPNVSYDFQSTPGGSPLGAQAFRLRDNRTTFQWSRIHRNTTNGLGVRRNLNGVTSNTIDNLAAATDLLLFDFGVANLFDTWTINFAANTGNDNAAIWVGNGLTSGDDLLGLNFNTLVSSAGFQVINGNLNVGSNDPYTFSTTMPYQYLVISANPNQNNDNFRVASIGASGIVRVPEPATLLLFAAGLLGFNFRRGAF